MTGILTSRWVPAVLTSSLLAALPLVATAIETASGGWVEQLTGFVLVQEGIARAGEESGLFDPYIGQVALVRSLHDRGDWRGSYSAMNRLMDMLESRDGGISAGAADAIWDCCYEVTPAALHDVKRHKQ